MVSFPSPLPVTFVLLKNVIYFQYHQILTNISLTGTIIDSLLYRIWYFPPSFHIYQSVSAHSGWGARLWRVREQLHELQSKWPLIMQKKWFSKVNEPSSISLIVPTLIQSHPNFTCFPERESERESAVTSLAASYTGGRPHNQPG